jgi:hypothetical protein
MVQFFSGDSSVMLTIVCVRLQPGYLQKLLPESAPDQPEALEDILTGSVFVENL